MKGWTLTSSNSPFAGRVFTRDRKHSVAYTAGRWTPAMIDSIQPPIGSTRFRVFYGTTETASQYGSSEWISYPDQTPRSWIESMFPDYSRVLTIIFDKA